MLDESVIKSWHGVHFFKTFGRTLPRNWGGTGKSVGELILTNKRLVFLAQWASPEGYTKEVDAALGTLISVEFKTGLLRKRVFIGSGVGNIELALDGVDSQSFNDFRSTIEKTSGKPLASK
jgi:hypothetical protein